MARMFDGTCPECGSTKLIELAGGLLECTDCGRRINLEDEFDGCM